VILPQINQLRLERIAFTFEHLVKFSTLTEQCAD
jgi:hypothetical protein